MSHRGCQFEEIVPVAGQEYAPGFVPKSKDGLIGRIRRKDFAQQHHIVTELSRR
jgi:hypothetical protein